MSEVGTMKVCGKGATIVGKEGRTPPLPFVTVSESEGHALIGLGVAEKVEAEDAPTEAPPAPASPPKVTKAAKSESPPAPPPPPAEEPEKAPEEAPKAPEGAPDPARVQTIVEGLDLVEPEHLETEGDRAGKPKPEAVAEITGLTDVTHAEVDAAIAAKDTAA